MRITCKAEAMDIRATSSFRPGFAAAIEENITSRVIEAVTEGSTFVMDEAKSLVPVDTGDLQSSIGMTIELDGRIVYGTISAIAGHAQFVEFGTGVIGRASPHGELPQSGVPITGAYVYDYKNQNWKGMAARPYLRPAFEVSLGRIRGAFASRGFIGW